MTSIVKQLFHIITKNWIGVILGILYSIFGFFMFFAGLSYGASCPDAGPEFCERVDVAIVLAIVSSVFYFFIPHMFSWSILYYSIQQDHFEAVVVVTSALWGIIGACSQQLIRNIRRK